MVFGAAINRSSRAIISAVATAGCVGSTICTRASALASTRNLSRRANKTFSIAVDIHIIHFVDTQHGLVWCNVEYIVFHFVG